MMAPCHFPMRLQHCVGHDVSTDWHGSCGQHPHIQIVWLCCSLWPQVTPQGTYKNSLLLLFSFHFVGKLIETAHDPYSQSTSRPRFQCQQQRYQFTLFFAHVYMSDLCDQSISLRLLMQSYMLAACMLISITTCKYASIDAHSPTGLARLLHEPLSRAHVRTTHAKQVCTNVCTQPQ